MTKPDAIRYGVPIESIGLLKQVYQFDQTAYHDEGQGTESIPWPLFVEWWESFPSGFLGSFEGDRPVAVIGLFPVTASWSAQFLTHKISEIELAKETITAGVMESESSNFSRWYFSGISAQRGKDARRLALPCLVGISIFAWLSFHPRLIDNKEIIVLAEASTAIGKKLVRRLSAFSDLEGHQSQNLRRYGFETTSARLRQILTESAFFRRCTELQNCIASHQRRDGGLAACGQRR